MTDFILGLIIVLIIGSAILYIRKSAKHGVKCIGCPDAPKCAKRQEQLAAGIDKNSMGCGGHCGSCSGGCGCTKKE